MKRIIWLFLSGLLFVGLPIRAAQTAKATIFCYSVRFQKGLDPAGNYFLDVSSVSGSNNGELALDFFNSGYTHSTFLNLTDELLGDTLAGQMALDVPDAGDANDDGFADFFQITQGVTNLTSAGAYRLSVYGDGSTTATWNRNAGSKDGWCVINMRLLPFQSVSFNLPFEILEYQGQLVYSPGTTNVIGMATLAQTGNTNNSMKGPVEFRKTPSNRFNELTLLTGAWTNESQQTLQHISHLITREETWPTNYYGYLEFDDDADAATFSPYAIWMLSIDDFNDSNHNGIPDFSDDPSAGARPRRPQLELVQTGTNAVLTLHGDIGYVHEIQECADLASTNWLRVLSVTPTNDPQTLLLPLPNGSVGFWRVKTN